MNAVYINVYSTPIVLLYYFAKFSPQSEIVHIIRALFCFLLSVVHKNIAILVDI